MLLGKYGWPRWRGSALLAVALGCALAGGQIFAQGEPTPVKPPETRPASAPVEQPPGGAVVPQIDPHVKQILASPRSMMETFLEGDPEDAQQCLDLSDHKLTPESRNHLAALVAFKLRAVINRMVKVDLKRIPERADTDHPCYLTDQASGLTDVEIGDLGEIVVAQDADGLWRFSPETVASVDALYGRWKDRPSLSSRTEKAQEQQSKPISVWIEEQFSEGMRTTTHVLLPDYQWVCVLVVILLGFLADLITRACLGALTKLWFRVRAGEAGFNTFRFWRPVGLFAQAVVWYFGARVIVLPADIMNVLLVGLKLFAIVTAVWTLFHLIDLLSRALARRAESTDTKYDDLLVPLVSTSLKFLVVCLGILQFAQTFELPLAGLLGGLGIGGMALAFASKDAVSNLFGSVTVLIDRPFEVGDWVVTEGVEGTVEMVGFRSTRIRTFHHSVITVPNSRLTTAIVDNMGRRQYRRIKTVLALEYGTPPARIEAFCEGIRELIRRHPYTRKDNYHIYLNELGSSSLDVLVYCFVACPDWAVELREKHRLYVDILKLADELGVSFAFPTQTLHVHQTGQNGAGANQRLADPVLAGRRTAASIVGPPLSEHDRPGHVEFPQAFATDD